MIKNYRPPTAAAPKKGSPVLTFAQNALARTAAPRAAATAAISADMLDNSYYDREVDQYLTLLYLDITKYFSFQQLLEFFSSNIVAGGMNVILNPNARGRIFGFNRPSFISQVAYRVANFAATNMLKILLDEIYDSRSYRETTASRNKISALFISTSRDVGIIDFSMAGHPSTFSIYIRKVGTGLNAPLSLHFVSSDITLIMTAGVPNMLANMGNAGQPAAGTGSIVNTFDEEEGRRLMQPEFLYIILFLVTKLPYTVIVLN